MRISDDDPVMNELVSPRTASRDGKTAYQAWCGSTCLDAEVKEFIKEAVLVVDQRRYNLSNLTSAHRSALINSIDMMVSATLDHTKHGLQDILSVTAYTPGNAGEPATAQSTSHFLAPPFTSDFGLKLRNAEKSLVEQRVQELRDDIMDQASAQALPDGCVLCASDHQNLRETLSVMLRSTLEGSIEGRRIRGHQRGSLFSVAAEVEISPAAETRSQKLSRIRRGSTRPGTLTVNLKSKGWFNGLDMGVNDELVSGAAFSMGIPM